MDDDTILIYEAAKAFRHASSPLDLDEAWRTHVAPLYEQLSADVQDLVSKAYNLRLDEMGELMRVRRWLMLAGLIVLAANALWQLARM